MRVISKAAATPERPEFKLSPDGTTVTVRVPMTFRQFGGRKQIYTPAGVSPWIPTSARINNTLVKAVVRAHRWRDMLESGKFSTVRELAKAEKINESYLGRVLRLTLLAPELVEMILAGNQPHDIELDNLLKPMSIEWSAQKALLANQAPI